MAAMAMAATASSAGAKLLSFEGLRCGNSEYQKEGHAQLAVNSSAVPQPAGYRHLAVVANKKGLQRTKIILTEDVAALGKRGDLLAVKKGYFRNFLYPFQKAKPATAKILKEMKLEQDKKDAEIRKIREDAETIARQFQTVGQFSVRRKVGKGKTIFGTVTAQDVADIIKAQTSRDIEKKNIELPEIKETGVFDVSVKLHPEVIAVIKINVIGKN